MTHIAAKNIILHQMALILFMVLFTMVLTSCSGDSGGSAPQPAAEADADALTEGALTEEEIARYQEKVNRKVSRKVGGAMVNAMVEDFGISRDQAECLNADPRIIGLERISNGDPEILALFDECGVDPAVVK